MSHPSQAPLRITGYTTVSALGRGNAAALAALRNETSGLRPCDFADAGIATWIGRVDGLEDAPIEGALAAFDCRNNRLARLGLDQPEFRAALDAIRRRVGSDRIGMFLGTSTSGIRQTEEAYARRDPATGALPADFNYRCTQNMFSVAEFSRRHLRLAGPALVVSTACSSSAKVFASAYRWMRAGLCDAAVVGGVDSLCLTTLYGFHALELTAPAPCRPWDAERNGLSLGEAAGFAILSWPRPGDDGAGDDGAGDDGAGDNGPALLGCGESSDAYHMTAPHPDGLGAALAMQDALDRAGITAAEVDCINLHGTGTPSNDAAEDKAVVRVFGTATPCTATKGWTGHTLGAAGITEAVLSCLLIEHGFIPATLNTRRRDPALAANLLLHRQDRTVNIVVSNSFGFGGSNCSLVLGRLGGRRR